MTLESYDKLLSSVLQEYKILAEYKRLASENLSGVYVIPSYENTFLWFGVIFIRSGIYKDGIFRFHITLPDTFPEDSTPPTVIFQSEIFHPLICPYNGTLELVDAFPTWTKDNYIWQILKYIQYIFYNFEDYSSVSEKFLNKNAVELYHQNRPEFLGHVSECIKLSHEKLHAPPPTQDKNYIVFGKFDAEIHGAILESIKKNGTTDSQQPNSGLSWVKEGVFHPLSK